MTEARIVADFDYNVGILDRRVFGSFVEHLGRCVYDGIYEPSHESADADGFRTDVLELVRELGVSTIRYPGGNFVSGYRWEDGIGPKDERPQRLDLAWHSLVTNQVGLNEFARWNARAGSEPMLAINLGTRGELEALDLLEYTNIRSGSTLSELRRTNGDDEPFGVTMWCLGNEMDGPWQLGHRSADDYGKLASRTAKAMRQLDPSVQLVVCGSSNSAMPTFGSWERTVLEHTYDDVDFISCHAYYHPVDGDLDSFLASSVNMDSFIRTVVATADAVGAARKSDKKIFLSFDEWNVWYQDAWHDRQKEFGHDDWPYAPRLLEDAYSVIDAVVVGNLLITLLQHADRVKAASLAQLVNVIAPIMTEPGGPAWRQTTFFPFALTSALAHETVLRLSIDSPTRETARYGEVPLVDAVATRDEATGEVSVFAVNRSRTETIEVTLRIRGTGDLTVASSHMIADDDIFAANTLEHPERVSPTHNDTIRIAGEELTVSLPPVSWTAIELTSTN
ncbi:MAG: abfA [Frondihabitans sp.]|nr:abfA [Frondihabitans sp.]